MAGILLLSPGFALAGEGDHSLEALVIEMAQTPKEHEALAQHFRVKADKARAKARRHESMASSYGGGRLTQRQKMKRHCTDLSEQASAMADDYEALAKLHQEAAKQAQ